MAALAWSIGRRDSLRSKSGIVAEAAARSSRSTDHFAPDRRTPIDTPVDSFLYSPLSDSMVIGRNDANTEGMKPLYRVYKVGPVKLYTVESILRSNFSL